MSAPIDPRVLRKCPLFATHTGEELADIALYLRPIRAAAGTRLFSQGEAAEGMYLVEEGRVRIVSRLPGDRVVELGQVGPGEPFGEVSLVMHSQHSTTAEVMEPVRGCFFSRMHFEMLRNDLRPSAFRTMNAITATLCPRIRDQIAEIRASIPAAGPYRSIARSARPTARSARPTARSARPVARRAGPLSGKAGRSGSSAQRGSLVQRGTPARSGQPRRRGKMAPELAPELLRQLPLFQPFSDRELKGFLAPLELRHLPRGTLLHPPGEEPRSCMLVVRGALRLSVTRGGAEEQLLVLGPAQMEGDLALMDGLPQAARCEVREDATLLEMTRPRFEALRQGGDPVAFKFFDSVNRSLVGMMRRNNRTLALLAVQGRTRSAPRHGT